MNGRMTEMVAFGSVRGTYSLEWLKWFLLDRNYGIIPELPVPGITRGGSHSRSQE